MNKKKITAALLAAVIACPLLVSCSDSSSASEETSLSSAASSCKAEQQEPTGYDTTVFTVSVPDGWSAAAVSDTLKKYDGKTNPEQLYIIKDGKNADDIMKYPYIWVNYYKDASRYASAKSMYENTEDVNIETGGKKWEGYTYTSSGYPGCCLTCKEGDSLWVCLFVLKNGDNSISINDEDVETILSSLKAK